MPRSRSPATLGQSWRLRAPISRPAVVPRRAAEQVLRSTTSRGIARLLAWRQVPSPLRHCPAGRGCYGRRVLAIDQSIFGSDNNFVVLLRDEATGETAAIDAVDGPAIAARLKQLGWGL